MILKNKDPIEPAVESLESLLALPNLPKDTVSKIKKELAAIRRGAKGEQECAFSLEGHVKDNPNRVLIHDLRIEFDGEVAQFDHIFINRRLEFWILESKTYSTGIKINDLGEFEYWAGNHYLGIPSPIEQVNRQARILRKVLESNKIQISRLGLTMRPIIKTAVLVAPTSRVIRPDNANFNTDQVIKADAFFTMYQKTNENFSPGEIFGALARIVEKDVIIEFGRKLVCMHAPAAADYAAKFGVDLRIADQTLSRNVVVKEPAPEYGKSTPETPYAHACPRCGGPMVHRIRKRGEKAGEAFWGCSSYPTCRGILPLETEPTSPESEADPRKESGEKTGNPPCPACGEAMVLRTARKGEKAGRQFYGCSHFPKCRGTVPIS